MIFKASERNVWFYKGMTLKYLPYVLLVNYGVFQKEEHRKNKVYFVFDSKLSNYEDLWIKPKIKQKCGRYTQMKVKFRKSRLILILLLCHLIILFFGPQVYKEKRK